MLRNWKSIKGNLIFIKRTIERYEKAHSIQDNPKSGRSSSKRTTLVVKARIARNPRRNLNTGTTTMRDLIQDYLVMYPYKLKGQHHLPSKVNDKRLERSNAMLLKLRTGTAPNIVFTVEKIFTVEEAFKPQNHRIVAKR
ncbi:uncharacterized protein [Lepeophtheirus salmonis]|uniref:uncharacterized protein n=1 Tax=Lepeophtheirus salmonis TaxID=72036 RepID=UPI003AF3D80C